MYIQQRPAAKQRMMHRCYLPNAVRPSATSAPSLVLRSREQSAQISMKWPEYTPTTAGGVDANEAADWVAKRLDVSRSGRGTASRASGGATPERMVAEAGWLAAPRRRPLRRRPPPTTRSEYCGGDLCDGLSSARWNAGDVCALAGNLDTRTAGPHGQRER